jgi:transcriptional regulator with XRE-family HTH domain
MLTFGEQLREKRKQARMTLDAVADGSGRSKTYIANLENNKPHPVSGAEPQPSREAVKDIAVAVNWNINEALRAAGYTPDIDPDTFPDPRSSSYHDDDIPDELKIVYGLHGNIVNALPPGKAREQYIHGLEVQAESVWTPLRSSPASLAASAVTSNPSAKIPGARAT